MFGIISKFFLERQISSLGNRNGILMPIEFISLGRKISELKSREDAYNIIDKFYDHESFAVKRAILISIRFMGTEAVQKFLDKLLESTKDEIGWIRYDAVWALGDSGINDIRIHDSLKRVAGDFLNLTKKELDKINPDEDDDYAKKRAAEKLIEYENRVK